MLCWCTSSYLYCTPTFPGPSASRKPGLRKQFTSSDGEKHPVHPGTMIHIPPGVLHGAVGKMRVLVVGIPDIDDSDVFYPDS